MLTRRGVLRRDMAKSGGPAAGWLRDPRSKLPIGRRGYLAACCSPSGKMILFTKKKITMEMPPFSTVVPML